MDVMEKYKKAKSDNKVLKEMFRDSCDNLVCVYGGYGTGWEVERIRENKSFIYHFKKRIEANAFINKLRKKKI